MAGGNADHAFDMLTQLNGLLPIVAVVAFFQFPMIGVMGHAQLSEFRARRARAVARATGNNTRSAAVTAQPP